MKKSNDGKYAYYQAIFGRSINQNVINAIMEILSLPQIVIEVFVRRRMGERRFSLIWAIIVAIFLYWLPEPLARVFNWRDIGTYYFFYASYVIMAAVSWLEIRRAPSVFDLKRFSLDRGKPFPFFYKIKIFGKSPTQRTIDTYLEPLFCIFIGFALILLSQYMTGTVILICSICHFLCNQYFAIRGDHFIMDKIDEIICNQDLTETFIQDRDVSPRGVPFYAQKPTTQELREGILDRISDFDSDAAVAS